MAESGNRIFPGHSAMGTGLSEGATMRLVRVG
jgi:hypothetical protein